MNEKNGKEVCELNSNFYFFLIANNKMGFRRKLIPTIGEKIRAKIQFKENIFMKLFFKTNKAIFLFKIPIIHKVNQKFSI
jgi:hypothetical protein